MVRACASLIDAPIVESPSASCFRKEPSGLHRRIEDIEILRALAISLVLIQHSVWNLVFNVPWLSALLGAVPMWCGVDLFFVVSGFVITRSLQPALQDGVPYEVLRHFWLRRAFRLWPASWFWLALMVLGSAMFRNPPFMGTLALNLRGALAGAFGFANIRFSLNGFGHVYGASFPYWSLSLEEQFYLVLPFLILLSRRRLAWVAAALLLVQLPMAHGRLYFFTRTDGLLWGVLIASSPALMRLAARTACRLSAWPGAGCLVLAVSLAGMTQVSPPFEEAPPLRLGLLAAFAALPVWLAAANADLFRAGRLQPPLLWLGSRSYALYLCHMPMFQCAAALSHRWPPVSGLLIDHVELRSVAIGVPLLAAAAEFTYRVIEMPLRRIGARLAAKQQGVPSPPLLYQKAGG
jgi:peptidoglycan/LPS O-acetylase OafA/YrhL